MDFRLIRHLTYFLAVAEEKHFGRAAERLGISQPPLSSQIKILEHSLGVELFERARTGVRLTPEGEAILPSVQRLADQARRLEEAVRDARAGRSRTMLVGAVTSAMFHPLGPTIRRLRKQRPDLSVTIVEMDSADAISALEREEIDAAIVRANRVAAPLQALPLFEDSLVVALPAGHPTAELAVVPLCALADERMVMCGRRVSPIYHDQIIAGCQKAGFSPRVVHEAGSILSQIAFIGCGIGIGLVPSTMTSVGTSDVIFRPLRERVEIITIALAWNSERLHPDTNSLAEIARNVCAASGTNTLAVSQDMA